MIPMSDFAIVVICIAIVICVAITTVAWAAVALASVNREEKDGEA